jgi:hypothetical protein
MFSGLLMQIKIRITREITYHNENSQFNYFCECDVAYFHVTLHYQTISSKITVRLFAAFHSLV